MTVPGFVHQRPVSPVFDRATLFRQIQLLLFSITYNSIFKFLCISQAVQDYPFMFLTTVSELSLIRLLKFREDAL